MSAVERRFDARGRLTLLAGDAMWVMVRRPRAMPFVMTRAVWEALSTTPVEPFSGAQS